ncbi:lycopene cyclase domain-containing protein [Pengzhenrongella sicca]|uniref:Lycopene cyclase domain-containing protein n=1 Tax=Pengzhenrongella sicca TaxID=2819238 RepID=A0A8A4ZCM3_9MICO|nr:lycopene cyclase domain-containing protein [Pengzhenrongella sicca]QTE29682.1 lycopene cyclase domain-containing protein [Pengzhenrongella sicca]
MTNALLNLAVLAALILGLGRHLRGLRAGPIVGAAVVLVAMTAVFDTVMIGVGLYVYDPDRILGVYVAGAPLEDFAYPLAAAIAMPALWTLFGARERRAPGEPGGSGPT